MSGEPSDRELRVARQIEEILSDRDPAQVRRILLSLEHSLRPESERCAWIYRGNHKRCGRSISEHVWATTDGHSFLSPKGADA